jgi:hypothetical protein
LQLKIAAKFFCTFTAIDTVNEEVDRGAMATYQP